MKTAFSLKRQITRVSLFLTLTLLLGLTLPALAIEGQSVTFRRIYPIVTPNGYRGAVLLSEDNRMFVYGYGGGTSSSHFAYLPYEDWDGTDWVDPEKISFYYDNVLATTSKGKNYMNADYLADFMVKTDGTLLGIGTNAKGQLGDGTTIQRDVFTPSKLFQGQRLIDVYAQSGSYWAITEDKTLWGWGIDNMGQLGDVPESVSEYDEDFNYRSEPVRILDNVVDFEFFNHQYNDGSRSTYHLAAVTESGDLYAWGHSFYHGFSSWSDEIFKRVFTPTIIATNVADFEIGMADSFFGYTQKDGSLWMWGQNNECQLGDGTNTDRVTPVKIMDNVMTFSLSRYGGYAIQSDGSLWAWGRNFTGLIGDGTNIEYRESPVHVMGNAYLVSAAANGVIAVTNDGTVWRWGQVNSTGMGDRQQMPTVIPMGVMERPAQ